MLASCLAGFGWSSVGGPPGPDEIEVTVIGPGFGESIVVHVGNGRWLITDSCIDTRESSNFPAPISYLEAIGVRPAEQVDLILATHWHQDHVRGLAQVVRRCPAAAFSCGQAMLVDEFLAYLAVTGGNLTTSFTSKPQELIEIARILKERNAVGRLANAGRELFTWRQGDRTACRAIALSPSDSEYHQFLDRVRSLMPQGNEPRRAAPAGDRNEVSVVLQIVWPERESVLLGADMIVKFESGRGWKAVMNEHARLNLPKSKIVKVPHHGSLNAHYEPMWRAGLDAKNIAVIAPYGRGERATRPPTTDDLRRIHGLSAEGYLTSSPRGSARERFDSAVERTLDDGGIDISDATPVLGMVQLRQAGEVWRARVFPPATSLVNAISSR